MILYRPIDDENFCKEKDTRRYLSNLIESRQELELRRLGCMLCTFPVASMIDDFLSGHEDIVLNIEDIMSAISAKVEGNIDTCIFLTKKADILDKINYPYYGRYLCQESGVLTTEADPFMWDSTKCAFCCFTYEKLAPAYTLNKLLIKKKDLDRLLIEEERRGKILTPTNLKSDVNNVLRLIELGIYDGKISGEKTIDREQAIQDLL